MLRADFLEPETMMWSRKALARGLATMSALVLLFVLQAADPARTVTSIPLTANSTGDENDLDFPAEPSTAPPTAGAT